MKENSTTTPTTIVGAGGQQGKFSAFGNIF